MKKIILYAIITAIFLAPIAFLTAQSNLQTQNKSVFPLKLKDDTLYSLSEGENSRNPDILVNASEEMLKTALPDGKLIMATNAFFINSNGKNILIDAGHGIKLFDNLKSLQIDAEKVDIILITHCHGDHINGLLKDGKESFPNATIYMSEKEYNYWLGGKSPFAADVKKILVPYQKRSAVKQFVPAAIDVPANNPLFPNIQPIALYGHTPGHTGFMLGEGKDKLFIWADLTHCVSVQTRYTEVSVSFDNDLVMAAEIRKKVLEYLAKNNIRVAGSHINYPGFGNIKATQDAKSYEFTLVK